MPDDIIALLVRNRRNRELLDTELAAEYTVTTLTDPTDIRTTEYDLLILDDPALHQSRSQLTERSTAAPPIPVPAILLQSPDSPPPQPEVWTHVDDVIHLPADKAVLTARIENLLRTRRLAQNYYETQTRLNSVVETATNSILILNADLEIVFANPAVTTLVGLDNAQLIGTSLRQLIPADTAPSVQAQLRDLLDRDAPTDAPGGVIETVVTQESGTTIPIQFAYQAFEHDGEVFITGILHDVSELKQRELRAQVLNRILRHDIRNDINVIDGYIELLDDETDPPEEYVMAIKDNVRDIVELSEKARQLDHLFEASEEPIVDIDVVPILRRLCTQAETAYPELSVETDLPAEAVVSGVSLLSSVFDNLIENAIEHNDCATLTVSVGVTVEDEVVTIEIADTGSGIPPEEIDVLERGRETATDHSSGLGLWLVNWLVNASNGEIRFQPNTPTGSQIRITLPAADGHRPEE